MNYIGAYLLLSLCALCAYAATNEFNVDQLIPDLDEALRECETRCRLGFSRSCSGDPDVCGDCLPGYRHRDGLCLYSHSSESSSVEEPNDDIEQLMQEAREEEEALSAEEESLTDEVAAEDKNGVIKGTAPRYTIQKVHHTPHQRHKDKLEQVNDVLMAEEAVTTAPPSELPVPQPMYAKPKGGVSHVVSQQSSMADIYFIVDSSEDERKRNSSSSSLGVEAVERALFANYVYILVIAGCSVAGLVGLIVAAVCWYRIQKDVKATSDTEYPAYGVTGPVKGHSSPPGDRKLAQSAQMYHYQHQKQQMLALEKAQGMMNKDGSDVDSDEENEEGDYTVYECPGLAPTGEMEVNNPLFGSDAARAPPAPPAGEDKVTSPQADDK